MLLPQPHKKSRQVDPLPGLETPGEIQLSIERDQALSARARRQQDEIAVDRQRFELTRDRIYLAAELVLSAAILIIVIVLWLTDQALLAATLLGGGGVGGIGVLLRRLAS